MNMRITMSKKVTPLGYSKLKENNRTEMSAEFIAHHFLTDILKVQYNKTPNYPFR